MLKNGTVVYKVRVFQTQEVEQIRLQVGFDCWRDKTCKPSPSCCGLYHKASAVNWISLNAVELP